MNYGELIARALNGRSVNSMAKAWGVRQPTLDRYVKGHALPDYDLALKIVKEAGVSVAEGFEVLADEDRNRKIRNFKLQSGFAKTKSLIAMALVTMTVNLFLTPTQANAAPCPMTQEKLPTTHSLYYVKRWLKMALRRAILTWPKRLFMSGAFQPAAS